VQKNSIDDFLDACFKFSIAPEPSIINRVGGFNVLDSLREVDEGDVEKRYLNLSNYGLGDERVVALAAALRTITFISRVNLSYNRLTSASVGVLMGSLMKKDCLIELELSGNRLDASCCNQLLDYVKSSLSINKLILDDCQIGDKEVEVLMPAFVFRRSRQTVDSETLREINGGNSENYSGVETLFMRKNKIGTRGGQTIAGLIERTTCSLTELNLSFNHIMGVGASELGTALNYNTSLLKLDLSVNR